MPFALAIRLRAGRPDHRQDPGLGVVIQGHGAGFQPAGQVRVREAAIGGGVPQRLHAPFRLLRFSLGILRLFVSPRGHYANPQGFSMIRHNRPQALTEQGLAAVLRIVARNGGNWRHPLVAPIFVTHCSPLVAPTPAINTPPFVSAARWKSASVTCRQWAFATAGLLPIHAHTSSASVAVGGRRAVVSDKLQEAGNWTGPISGSLGPSRKSRVVS